MSILRNVSYWVAMVLLWSIAWCVAFVLFSIHVSLWFTGAIR